MQTTYYKKQTGALNREIYAKDGQLILAVYAKTERADIDLVFTYGPESEKSVQELKKSAAELAWQDRYGLMSLLRYAEENVTPPAPDLLHPDGIVGGTDGNFSSTLYVKDGMIYYDIESCCIGFFGEAHFQLGAAEKSRVKKLLGIIEKLENHMSGIVYMAKHTTIDNAAFDDEYDDDWGEITAFHLDEDPISRWKVNGKTDYLGDNPMRNFRLFSAEDGFHFTQSDDDTILVLRYIDSAKERTMEVKTLYFCEAIENSGEILGYRYQLEENGKWGFISRFHGQMTAPIYEAILVADRTENILIGWYHDENGEVMISLSRRASFEEITDLWLRICDDQEKPFTI